MVLFHSKAGHTFSSRASFVLIAAFIVGNPQIGMSSSGTQGAAFLDIPVGGGPAALGSAYTAMANDAYAPTWNPAGLGFLDSTQISGQHLAYLDTLHSEHMSFVFPLPLSACSTPSECPHTGLGGSIQYLGSGDIDSTDPDGNPLGEFSNHYVSYNLALGRSFNSRLALGLTGKLISAKLADTSASAYAADIGAMYRPNPRLKLATTVTNIGTKLKFEEQADPLPLAAHFGAAYQFVSNWLVTTEVVYPKTGLASFRAGGEWQPVDALALRAGYRTDTTKQLSTLAGFSTGLGIHIWGSDLAYAWVPYGDLGDTHYVSLTLKFNEHEADKRNLIQYRRIKTHRMANSTAEDASPEYQMLIELLTHDEKHLASNTELPPGGVAQ